MYFEWELLKFNYPIEKYLSRNITEYRERSGTVIRKFDNVIKKSDVTSW